MPLVEVDCSSIANNPQCPHGPMVKFTKTFKDSIKQFYGCSACRDPKECPFSIDVGEEQSEAKLKMIADVKSRLFEVRSFSATRQVRSEMAKLKVKRRQFCKYCFEFVLPKNSKLHEGHDVISGITDKVLSTPSYFLSAKTDDKKEAQYWFDQCTKSFLVSAINDLKANAVVCIGTPTIFEMLRNQNRSSLLLDIDPRYVTFYNENEFALFNMFNFHFLINETNSIKIVRSLLDASCSCVIIDPPFGCRLELLSYTINCLRQLSTGILYILLVLPYFMEPRVLQNLPDFKMSDYVLHYKNHSKLKNHKKSAVRFFTNAPLSLIKLPAEEGYRLCSKCNCWRSVNNRHCNICATCPSKNGTTYKHCGNCNICVKASWEHCDSCERCFLAPHKCHDNPLLKRKMKEKCVKNKKKKS